MNESDKPAFVTALTSLYGFYERPLTPAVLSLFWHALKGYSWEEIRHACEQHLSDPTAGRFVPKPADLIRQLDVRSDQAAQFAWEQVERAIRDIGAYDSVHFEDPVIHEVITRMGGWVQLCHTRVHCLSDRQASFCERYKALSADLSPRADRPLNGLGKERALGFSVVHIPRSSKQFEHCVEEEGWVCKSQRRNGQDHPADSIIRKPPKKPAVH